MHRTILALLLLLLFSTACAARDSRTLDQVTAYPDAVVLEEAENAMADIMASTLRDFTSEVAESEITLYALPNDATWDAVSAHYDEATAQSDWVPNDALTMSYDDYRARGWRRPASATSNSSSSATSTTP